MEPTILLSASAGPLLLSAFAPRAPKLIRLLFAGIAGALPDWRCKEIGDLIYSLLTVGCTSIISISRRLVIAAVHSLTQLLHGADDAAAGL